MPDAIKTHSLSPLKLFARKWNSFCKSLRHPLQSALAILRDGGSAIEAMVAAAATIAVVYPHMNGLGGDGFWLIVPPEGDPIAIDASGAAGSLATLAAYGDLTQIPHRGPRAALTVAGTVSGWEEALNISHSLTGNALPLSQ